MEKKSWIHSWGSEFDIGIFVFSISKWGIEEIEIGENYFDPTTSIPCPDGEESGKIVQVMEEGYKWNNRVLCAAKVIAYEGGIYCLKCV